jgi:hypothetical protein
VGLELNSLNMGIFGGGEKYSREAYEKAEHEATVAENAYASRGTVREAHSSHIKNAQAVYDALIRGADKARQRVEKLYGKGHAEAIALNEEYDRLLAQAQEAVKAIEIFEKEKLGMSEETES